MARNKNKPENIQHRERCYGKIAYDKKSAQTASNLRKKRDHTRLRIYHCGDCNLWHLTKITHRHETCN